MSSSKITTEVTDLAARLSKEISFADGKLSIDAETYVKTLPEDISVEMIKKVHDHNSNFYPAATMAAGEAAIAAMKKDKKLDSVSLDIPLIAKDMFGVTVERSRVFPNPQGGDATTVWGNVKATLTTQSARASRGMMNHVRDQLAEEAMKAFGKAS